MPYGIACKWAKDIYDLSSFSYTITLIEYHTASKARYFPRRFYF